MTEHVQVMFEVKDVLMLIGLLAGFGSVWGRMEYKMGKVEASIAAIKEIICMRRMDARRAARRTTPKKNKR